MLSQAPTGVLTEFDPALRSGERAAREVLAADDPVHAGRSRREERPRRSAAAGTPFARRR